MKLARSLAPWLAVVAVVGLVLLADEASAQKRGGTLVMVVQPEPPTLASYISTSGPIGQVTTKIYEGLLEYDFNLKPSPASRSRGRSAPTARPSPSSCSRRRQVPRRPALHQRRREVHRPRGAQEDPSARHQHVPRGPEPSTPPIRITAVFRLAEPAPYMLMALSGYESPMLPKHVFGHRRHREPPHANKPVGTGPFKFVEWQKGQFIRFDRNPDYRKPGRPYLDRIVARFIGRRRHPRRGAREAGGADRRLQRDPAARRQAPAGAAAHRDHDEGLRDAVADRRARLQHTRKTPFDNLKVRQAVAYAIDRKFVIDNVWFGFGKPATGPISSNFKAERPLHRRRPQLQRPQRRRDRQQAARRGRLSSAGPTAPASRSSTTSRRTARNGGASASTCSSSWPSSASRLTLRYEDVPTWLALYTNYDFQISSNWIQTLADPVIGVHRLYHSKMISPGTVFVNETGWSSPRDGRADGPGHRRARSEEARRVLSGVPEARRGGRAARLGLGAGLHDRLQQAVQGLDREPARSLLVLRSGVTQDR